MYSQCLNVTLIKVNSVRSPDKLALDLQLSELLAPVLGDQLAVVVGEEVAASVGGANVLTNLEGRSSVLTNHVSFVFTVVLSDLLNGIR